MNAAQLTHIFWKEYRTQRGLWLVFVGFFFALTAAGTLFVSSQSRLGLGSLLTIGFVMMVIYLLSSTAILFSSEREQKTDQFLQSLPTNPWMLLGGKLAWVGSSSLAAMVLYTLLAVVVASPEWGLKFDFTGVGATATLLLYLFSCCLLASMLTRNVVTSLAMAGALLLVGLGPVESLVHWTRGRYFDGMTIIIGLSLVMLSIAVELNRRWFREREWRLDLNLRLSRAMTLQAAIAESRDSSTWLLHVWREMHSARIWLPALAMLAIYTAWVSFDTTFDPEARFANFAVNMCLIPLLAGVGSCRGDQSQKRFRFLGDRGISASQTLWAKHAVWLGGCTIVLLCITLSTWASPRQIDGYRQDQFTGSLELIPVSIGYLSSARVEQLSQSLIPAITFWVSVSLLMYALGHLLSLLLSQPILSLMVSCFFAVFVAMIVVFYYTLDVPLFILTIAPAICLLSLSFYRGEDWLAERKTVRDWKRFLLFAALGLWTVVTLLASWRVFEIPWSTAIDSNGLYNQPTWYAFACLAGLLLISGVFWLGDWIRTTFRDRAGRPLFVPKRWCTFGTIVVTFLVGHNLLNLAALFGHDWILHQRSEPFRMIVFEDLGREKNKDSLKHQAEFVEWTFNGRPFPKMSREELLRAGSGEEAFANWPSWADVTEEQRLWLANNQNAIQLFFDLDQTGAINSTRLDPWTAAEQPAIVMESRTVTYQPQSFFDQSRNMLLLMRLEALRLEHEGRLEDAWNDHLAIIRYARRFATHNFPEARWQVLSWLDETILQGDLWRWQARREQTPELLARAARELHAELAKLSPLAEAYQRQAGWSLLFLDELSTTQMMAAENLAAGMPWEKERLRSLIVEQSLLAIQLAEQVDQGNVRLATGYNRGYPETYVFDRRRHDSINGDPGSVYIDADPEKGVYDLRIAGIYSASRPLPPESRSTLHWSDAGPPSKTETTFVVTRMPDQATTLEIVKADLAEVLISEMRFNSSLRWCFNRFPIYSYRAETGAFPADLNRLKNTRTSELFRPFLPEVAFSLPEIEIDQFSRVASVLEYESLPDSSLAEYVWAHPARWRQPEYNRGDTPDRKPVAPISAPKPAEVQQ